MTVHSPPSTSLGTRRSDDDKEMDLLEAIKSLRNVMAVHSPPKHEPWDKARWFVRLLLVRIRPRAFSDHT
jgi:hypothetical protein